jgi:hypothetical protein
MGWDDKSSTCYVCNAVRWKAVGPVGSHFGYCSRHAKSLVTGFNIGAFIEPSISGSVPQKALRNLFPQDVTRHMQQLNNLVDMINRTAVKFVIDEVNKRYGTSITPSEGVSNASIDREAMDQSFANYLVLCELIYYQKYTIEACDRSLGRKGRMMYRARSMDGMNRTSTDFPIRVLVDDLNGLASGKKITKKRTSDKGYPSDPIIEILYKPCKIELFDNNGTTNTYLGSPMMGPDIDDEVRDYEYYHTALTTLCMIGLCPDIVNYTELRNKGTDMVSTLVVSSIMLNDQGRRTVMTEIFDKLIDNAEVLRSSEFLPFVCGRYYAYMCTIVSEMMDCAIDKHALNTMSRTVHRDMYGHGNMPARQSLGILTSNRPSTSSTASPLNRLPSMSVAPPLIKPSTSSIVPPPVKSHTMHAIPPLNKPSTSSIVPPPVKSHTMHAIPPLNKPSTSSIVPGIVPGIVPPHIRPPLNKPPPMGVIPPLNKPPPMGVIPPLNKPPPMGVTPPLNKPPPMGVTPPLNKPHKLTAPSDVIIPVIDLTPAIGVPPEMGRAPSVTNKVEGATGSASPASELQDTPRPSSPMSDTQDTPRPLPKPASPGAKSTEPVKVPPIVPPTPEPDTMSDDGTRFSDQ